MDRRDFLKKGAYTTAGLIAYPALCNGKDIGGPKSINQYNTNADKYRQIEWVFYKDSEKTIYGTTPDVQKIKKLEEVVCTDKKITRMAPTYLEPIFAHKDPKEIVPTVWDITALAKLVPVKNLIEKHSQYFSINPMWATMFFTYESLLKPADHNRISNDFGLGQIKLKSEKLAKSLGTNTKSKLYSPYLDKKGIIFEPETNIIMAMLLHRYNIESMNLKNSDQVYAIYAGGKEGLSFWSKKPNSATREKVKSIHDRFTYYGNIIPLFRLKNNEVANVENPDARFLLELYHSNLEPREMYEKELEYFKRSLEQNLTGDVRDVLVYDDCVTFKRALELSWGYNPRGMHGNLLEAGSEISKLVRDNPDLKNRVEKTIEVLKDRETVLPEEPRKKLFGIF